MHRVRICTFVFTIVLLLITMFFTSRQPSTPLSSVPSQPFRVVGSSFSIPYAEWLHGRWEGPGVGPTWEESLRQMIRRGMKYIRLSMQMNEITSRPSVYDFRKIDRALEICRERDVKVLLCLGVKSPRWREVHLPEYLVEDATRRVSEVASHELNLTKEGEGASAAVLQFVRTALLRYRSNPVVTAFQIENEPLEPFGDPGLSVPVDFLRAECQLARSLTKKPLAVTMGAGFTDDIQKMRRERPYILDQLLALPVEWVGLNIYLKGYVRTGRHGQSVHSFQATESHWWEARKLVERIKKAGKKPFLAEVQFEPWQKDPKEVNYTDPQGNTSLAPDDALRVVDHASRLGVERMYLWGGEFAEACAAQGNGAWVQATETVVSR